MELPDNTELAQFFLLFNRLRDSRTCDEEGNSIGPALESEVFLSQYEIRDHKDIINTLKEKCLFQEWLIKQECYRKSLEIIKRKNLIHFVRKGEVFRSELHSAEEELAWRLQYVFCVAILVHQNSGLINNIQIFSEGIGKKYSVPEKIIRTAQKLRKYLEEEGVEYNKYNSFRRELDLLSEGYLSIPGKPCPLEFTDKEKLKLAIREIAITGSRLFLPKNSTKGRFSPEIAVEIVSLFDPIIDIRSINLFLAPYDLKSGKESYEPQSRQVVERLLKNFPYDEKAKKIAEFFMKK